MVCAAMGSELHAVRAFEAQNLARLLGRRDLIAELLDQTAHLANLLGIALRELAAADVEAILQAHAHVAAHHHGLGGERDLDAAGPQHRPVIIVPEQLVGGALHAQESVDVAADAAENAEYELEEDRRLEYAAINAVREIIKVPGVVAFVLELGALPLPHQL